MLFFVLVALLVAFLVVLAFSKRFAFGAFFVSAGVFAMAGYAAAGGLFIDPDEPVTLRLVTLNEPPHVAVQAGLELTTAGYRAKSISILVHRNDLAELREHIKYELRRGNITAETATTLNYLVDEIDLEASVDVAVGQVAAQQEVQQRALFELTQSQAKLSKTLADTKILVTVLGSVSSPEFAGTFIAAKIQVLRLLAEKAAVDGSIDEIRQSMKRPKAG
ncbi:MAG: hypothetical protein Q7T14_01065 [Aestuariivirga sp.]|nr:hypothetical protein [Aestuariivirga sp.]